MLRKRFWAVACATAMVASMTAGLSVNVFAADDTKDFAGEELSILVSAGWMDNRYDETLERFEDTYDVTVDLQTIPADQYSDLLWHKRKKGEKKHRERIVRLCGKTVFSSAVRPGCPV